MSIWTVLTHDDDELEDILTTHVAMLSGHLLRLNVGRNPLHALRIRLEYRNYDPNYLPSYFDTLYEIQRYQYLPRGEVDDLAKSFLVVGTL